MAALAPRRPADPRTSQRQGVADGAQSPPAVPEGLAGALKGRRAVADGPSDATPSASSDEEARPTETPPPPEVYVQPDVPPEPPGLALRLRIVTPWGRLPGRPLGGSTDGRDCGLEMQWELSDEGGDAVQGWRACDPDGTASLSAEQVSAWLDKGWTLRVLAEGCQTQVLARPPPPLPATLEVVMVPEGSLA